MGDRAALAIATVLVAACGFSVTAPTTSEPPLDAPIEMIDAAPGSEPTVTVCGVAGLQCAQAAVVIDCTGACWVGCRESTEHATAKERCAEWGGELARIDSLETQECVNTKFSVGAARWLGIEQDATAVWSWSGDGMAMPYVNWAGGQPNDGDGQEDGEEQCAYMSNPSGVWHDTPCTTPAGAFTCRR